MTGEEDPAGRPAVVLQHRADAPGGLLNGVLADHGFRPQTVRLDLGEPLPDPAAFALAVTLGPDQPVGGGHGDTVAIDWLRGADRAGVPVLGLGSGAQALAVALGGGVDRAPRSRHGWVWVSSTTPAWIADGPWLAWRDEVIRLPPKARLLAHDPIGPQVFGTARHLGVQFHPEVTPEIVAEWIRPARDESLDAQGILEFTSREFATASLAGRRLLSTYVHSLARHAA